MSMNREHALELLTLLAVIAIVQVPLNDPARPGDANAAKHGDLREYDSPKYDSPDLDSANHGFDPSPPSLASRVVAPRTGLGSSGASASLRLDPIALLQARVPADWRVTLTPLRWTPRAESSADRPDRVTAMTC